MKTDRKLPKYFPTLVEEVTVTRPTMELTGVKTYEELKSKAGELFTSYSNDDLQILITNKLHKGKLKTSDVNKIKAMTKEEKRTYLMNNLTMTLHVTQEREGNVTDSKLSKRLNFFMGDRINIGSNESTKHGYITLGLGRCIDLNPEIGEDLAAQLVAEGNFIYIQRITDFEAETNDADKITSEPKRMGKDGDVVTKDGKLLFMHTDVIVESGITADQAKSLYSKYYEEETDNEIQYAHDKEGNLDAELIPSAKRKTGPDADGAFEDAFNEWLTTEYRSRNLGEHVVIGAKEVLNS